MSYKILLVDDEPLILSGIKFLLDWKTCDCEVVATARNGQAALDTIKETQPDIVFCDINMPVMDGITLLKTASHEYPHTVFVMLTNLEDFELVRSAMQLRAVDYVLKSQLEPPVLAKAVQQAIEEVKKRAALSQASLQNNLEQKNNHDCILDALQHLFQLSEVAPATPFIKTLERCNALHRYGALQIFFDFSTLPQFAGFTQEEENRLFAWQFEITKKIATNFFKCHVLTSISQTNNSALLFVWDINTATWQSDTQVFAKRLNTASMNVTQCSTSSLATNCFADPSAFSTFHQDVISLCDYYYATNCNYAFATQLPAVYLEPALRNRYRSLSLNGISNYFLQKLQGKDIRGCHLLIEKVIHQILTTYHQRTQATWVCRELYDTFYYYAVDHPIPTQENDTFYSYDTTQRQINHALTQEQTITWLLLFQSKVTDFLECQNTNKGNLLDKACEYIQQNVDKRILLQDIASYAAISPSYLSTLFKKTFHKSIVDYINETKIQRARTLIEEEKLLIYEISSNLGFDNAYYFTKVFKRYTGMTPTEYQAKWKTRD